MSSSSPTDVRYQSLLTVRRALIEVCLKNGWESALRLLTERERLVEETEEPAEGENGLQLSAKSLLETVLPSLDYQPFSTHEWIFYRLAKGFNCDLKTHLNTFRAENQSSAQIKWNFKTINVIIAKMAEILTSCYVQESEVTSYDSLRLVYELKQLKVIAFMIPFKGRLPLKRDVLRIVVEATFRFNSWPQVFALHSYYSKKWASILETDHSFASFIKTEISSAFAKSLTEVTSNFDTFLSQFESLLDKIQPQIDIIMGNKSKIVYSNYRNDFYFNTFLEYIKNFPRVVEKEANLKNMISVLTARESQVTSANSSYSGSQEEGTHPEVVASTIAELSNRLNLVGYSDSSAREDGERRDDSTLSTISQSACDQSEDEEDADDESSQITLSEEMKRKRKFNENNETSTRLMKKRKDLLFIRSD